MLLGAVLSEIYTEQPIEAGRGQMNTRILSGMTIVLLLCLAGGGASAAVITYTASGTISDSRGLGPPPFPDGTPLSAQFSIDTNTPDSDPSSNVGRYLGLTGTFTLGEQTYSIDSYGYRYVEVANNYSPSFGEGDLIRIVVSTSDFTSLDTPVYNGVRIHNLKLYLFPADRSTNIFDSDVLSNSIGANLAAFPQSRWNMQLGDLVYINSDTVGPVTALSSSSVVPIPAAAWLFGSALGLVGVARRRKAT